MVKYCAALLASVCLISMCSAEEPNHVEVPNMQPSGPGDFGPGNSPVMWLGVESCGEYVVWLVFPDHISVVNHDHHPKDMKEFMEALKNSKIPSDMHSIPCTGAAL